MAKIKLTPKNRQVTIDSLNDELERYRQGLRAKQSIIEEQDVIIARLKAELEMK